jgi:Skp family chaperone for outer membrane proteins
MKISAIFLFSFVMLSFSCYGETKIGVIDFKELWTSLTAVDNVKKDLELTLKKAHQEFSEMESELRKENIELLDLAKEKKEKAEIEKLDKKKNSFERKVIDVQKKAEKRQKFVNTAHANAINKIKQILNEVIKEVAEENGISLVIYNENTIYHTKALDIMPLVRKKAEEKTRGIHLEMENSNGG